MPNHMTPYDSHTHIKISLQTKDSTLVRRRAVVHNEPVEALWRDLDLLPVPENAMRYRKAVQTARLNGFVYHGITDLAGNADLGDLVDRVLAISIATPQDENDPELRDALLGTVELEEKKWSRRSDLNGRPAHYE